MTTDIQHITRPGSTGCNEGQTQQSGIEFFQALQPEQAARLSRIRASLEHKGFSLHRVTAPQGTVGYLAIRWGLTRELRDINHVEDFAKSVGAAR